MCSKRILYDYPVFYNTTPLFPSSVPKPNTLKHGFVYLLTRGAILQFGPKPSFQCADRIMRVLLHRFLQICCKSKYS
jgi:hypothetical protein